MTSWDRSGPNIQVSWLFTRGEHGLPLIGSGDWNGGMNMVGEQGKDESIWLGFFLYDVLRQFTKIARLRGDLPFAQRCQRVAADMRQSIEQHGWNGEWNRRAYFDDGSPLESARNSECQIDSIAYRPIKSQVPSDTHYCRWMSVHYRRWRGRWRSDRQNAPATLSSRLESMGWDSLRFALRAEWPDGESGAR